jgi:hypothetical protein
MASIVRFIVRRLRLKVNATKSAVARPEERHFLGFRLRRDPLDEDVKVLLSERSIKRLDSKIRELTPRNYGSSVRDCIAQINGYVNGWLGHFHICTSITADLTNADAHIRRRLRAIQLKHWKRRRTMVRKLIAMGAKPSTARRGIYGGYRALWALSHIRVVDTALSNSYWARQGLVSLAAEWQRQVQTRIACGVQLRLPW